MEDANYVGLHNIKWNKARQCYDWEHSIGANIPFKYKDIVGNFELVSIISNKLVLKYEDDVLDPISTKSLRKCALGDLLKRMKRSNESFKKDFYERTDSWIFMGEYNGNARRYDFMCKKCKHIYNTHVATILNDTCPACSGRVACNYDYHNSLYVTHPILRKYFIDDFAMLNLTCLSYKKVKLLCPYCNNPREMIASELVKRGFSCNFCGDSIPYGEKFGYNVIKQLSRYYPISNIEREYARDWTNGRSYDIKFDYQGRKYLIELDGSFHYNDNQMSKMSKELSMAIDKYKDEMAKDNGYAVIRIDTNYEHACRFDYIKHSFLNSRLSTMFNLDLIDWEEVGEFALNSLAIKCCEIKKNNPHMTTKQIAKELNNVIGYGTVKRYLVLGNRLGLCDYCSKTEVYGRTRIGDIYVYKDGVLQNETPFYSIRDLVSKSEECFGVKFSSTSISRKLKGLDNGKQSEEYYGYTFTIKRTKEDELYEG